MAASQQLFYCIRPPLDRMLGEVILMLVHMIRFSSDGCFAATILLYPAPTGQDARGEDPNASLHKEIRPGCFAATILLNLALKLKLSNAPPRLELALLLCSKLFKILEFIIPLDMMTE